MKISRLSSLFVFSIGRLRALYRRVTWPQPARLQERDASVGGAAALRPRSGQGREFHVSSTAHSTVYRFHWANNLFKKFNVGILQAADELIAMTWFPVSLAANNFFIMWMNWLIYIYFIYYFACHLFCESTFILLMHCPIKHFNVCCCCARGE